MLALSKEKHNLTHELQKKIKEIHKEKFRLRKQIRAQPELFAVPPTEALASPAPPSLPSSESEPERVAPEIAPSWNLVADPKVSRNTAVTAMHSQEVRGKNTGVPQTAERHALERSGSGVTRMEPCSDPRVAILQRDRDIYDTQSKTMLHQIMVLTIQLEESKQRSAKCTSRTMESAWVDRRLIEDMRANRLSRADTAELAAKIERKGSEVQSILDSSVESMYRYIR